MSEIKVIMQAGEIPDNSVVTREKGDKQHTLKRVINIYNEYKNDGTKQTIGPSDGVLFLISEGYITAVKDTILLKWITEKDTFINYLRSKDY